MIVGTPFEALCQKLILVTAPFEESVRRICARDGISPEMAARRLQAQPPQTELEKRVDFILNNDGTPDQLAQKVEALLKKL